MATIKVRQAESADCAELSFRLSAADRAEVWASARLDALGALLDSFAVSAPVRTILIDGQPEGMFGVRAVTQECGALRVGVIWLLGSDRLRTERFALFRRARRELLSVADGYHLLVNCVSNQNTRSIAWLRWLGARLGDPVPMGPDGVLFRPFVLAVAQKGKAA